MLYLGCETVSKVWKIMGVVQLKTEFVLNKEVIVAFALINA